MPNTDYDWTSVKLDWDYELGRLKIQQRDVADFIGVSEQVMSRLVKAMTSGQGLTATPRDQERWAKAISYVRIKQQDQKEVAK